MTPGGGETLLVTGAGGFIGAHLCRRLLADGHRVHGVSRSARSSADGVRWSQCDLTDARQTARLFESIEPQRVFHLASLVSGSRDLAMVLPIFQANLQATVNLLLAAAVAGCRRVVLAGSQEEPDPGDPASPCSPYAAAKLAARQYAQMFNDLYALPTVVARLYMVYGPDQPDEAKLVPYTITSLLAGRAPRLSGGTRAIDWIYVDDVVEGLLALAWQPGIAATSVDLGTGRLTTVRQVVELLVNAFPGAPRPEFGAVAERPMEVERRADVERTAALLGWRPEVSLESGLQRTLAWYRQRAAGSGA